MLFKAISDAPLKHTIIEYDFFLLQVANPRKASSKYYSQGTAYINTFIIELMYPYFESLIKEFHTKFKDEIAKVNSDPTVQEGKYDPAITYKGRILYTDLLGMAGIPTLWVDDYFRKAKESEKDFLDFYVDKLNVLSDDYAFLSLWARSLFTTTICKTDGYKEPKLSLNKWAIPMFLKTNPWLEEFLEDNKSLVMPQHLKETYNKADNILLKYVSYNLVCSI